MILNHPVPKSDLKYYLLTLVGMCSVILGALAFEHIGGYQPCKLCLEQREPWYLGIPVLGLAVISLLMKWPTCLTRGLMLIGGWWKGPGDCGAVEGGISADTGNFLQQLEQSVPPSCTDAALRIMGLSFAGWNAVASAILAVLAFRTAFKA